MNSIQIAQIQFQVKYDNVKANIETAFSLAEEACINKSVDFLVLPEMWSTGFIKKERILDNIQSTSEILEKFRNLAAKSRTNIICGTLPEIQGDSLFNTAFFIDEHGDLAGKYSKIHLFPLMDEPDIFVPGSQKPIFDTNHGRIGLAICFDLRYPELFRYYRQKGVELLFLSAQFPTPRLDHWLTLVRARAIENQFFVVGTNCVGKGGNTDFPGNSLVVDPWGQIVANYERKSGANITTIDMELVDTVRKQLPCPLD